MRDTPFHGHIRTVSSHFGMELDFVLRGVWGVGDPPMSLGVVGIEIEAPPSKETQQGDDGAPRTWQAA
jgi:hypothetical protein